MFEVIGEGEYNWYDTVRIEIGYMSTLQDARDLIKRFSDHQYAEACQRHTKVGDYVTRYTINFIYMNTTVFDDHPIRKQVEQVEDPHAHWYEHGYYGLSEVDHMDDQDKDWLMPPSLGEWIQHQYDVCFPGKVSAASMYVWTSVQRKIKDRAKRMCKRIKHKR